MANATVCRRYTTVIRKLGGSIHHEQHEEERTPSCPRLGPTAPDLILLLTERSSQLFPGYIPGLSCIAQHAAPIAQLEVIMIVVPYPHIRKGKTFE
eukprot:2191212-Amphidinium_carterae.1